MPKAKAHYKTTITLWTRKHPQSGLPRVGRDEDRVTELVKRTDRDVCATTMRFVRVAAPDDDPDWHGYGDGDIGATAACVHDTRPKSASASRRKR
jgi:hypothetical protein